MTAQTKTDFENFKLHIEQQQKQEQLDEREKNDNAIAGIRQENAVTAGRNADTNASRAASYDKSINDRNQRALDNIGIKLQAAKTKGADASKDPAYRALETQYKQVSQDLRASQALGAQTTPEQTLALQDKLTALSSKMDMYVNSKSPGGGGAAPAGGDDGAGVKPAQTDIDYLKANPGVAAQFDARFGKGASSQYVGQ
jgi:3-deoxy-D-arabino-heptulosonate 7-phosphate (DAHP) synthase